MHTSVKCNYSVRDYVIHYVGIIVNRNLDTDQIQNLRIIAVKAGILNGRHFRSQFDLCQQRLFLLDDVDHENQVSLSTAVIAQRSAGGQSFVKCNCSGARKC